jgi:hypothetical protein
MCRLVDRGGNCGGWGSRKPVRLVMGAQQNLHALAQLPVAIAFTLDERCPLGGRRSLNGSQKNGLDSLDVNRHDRFLLIGSG